MEEKLTGWQYIADKWYFFDQDGVKKTGWVNDGSWYYLAADGSMQTGWKFISGNGTILIALALCRLAG